MCELLALSARHPATLALSWSRFAPRGGRLGPHGDGWGVAAYQGPAAQLVRDPRPAAESPLARFLIGDAVRSTIFVSHIRRATQGAVSLANTQPFSRELAGRDHVLAHNGDLRGVRELWRPGRFRPVGETDSEVAFCLLLEELVPLWAAAGRGVPPLEARLDAFARVAARLRTLGPANLLYSDSDALFVHAHRRTQPDGAIRPPGLHLLSRRCAEPADHDLGPGARLRTHERDQAVVLVASVPLTEEGWRPLEEGEVLALRGGEVVARARG